MSGRILYLDIIRIMACVMIVAMHAPIPNTGLNSYVLSTDSLLTAPGIGLFVMVSGALLLPMNMSTKQFLKKRFRKIVFPTLFWTLFYMLAFFYENGADRIDPIRVLLTMPFSNQYGATLWFLYMIAGLYLLVPILSSWIKNASKKEVEFYLILWTITLCYPYIGGFVGINDSNTGILYYFGGYAGYFLLGYYLRTYVIAWNIWRCFILFLVPLSFAAFLKYWEIEINFYDSFGYLSFFVAMMSVGWFLLVKNVVLRNDILRPYRDVSLVSNCCFGIYLVHLFVMRSLIWQLTWLHDFGILQIILVAFLTFIVSFTVTWLISYLPGAEYIIGFRQKR